MFPMASLSVLPIAPEGNLSRYLQEIRKFPMLTPEEELQLAKRWKEQGDERAAHQPDGQQPSAVAVRVRSFHDDSLPCSVAPGGGSVDDVPAYEPPVDGTEDDSAQEPSSPSSPARPRITVTTAQPPVVSRPTTTKPTSDGASGRPQPQHKPRSQRKK